MNRVQETQKLQSYAETVWEVAAEIFPALVKFDCPQIVLNGRYTRVAGMSFYMLNKIDISLKYYIFHKKQVINTILVHELAHQITYNLYGDKAMKAENGHGIEWQFVMLKLGQTPNRFHELSIPNMKLSEMLELVK